MFLGAKIIVLSTNKSTSAKPSKNFCSYVSTMRKKIMQQNSFCCPNKTFSLSKQNLIDKQNIFVDLTKLFSKCIIWNVSLVIILPKHSIEFRMIQKLMFHSPYIYYCKTLLITLMCTLINTSEGRIHSVAI